MGPAAARQAGTAMGTAAGPAGPAPVPVGAGSAPVPVGPTRAMGTAPGFRATPPLRAAALESPAGFRPTAALRAAAGRTAAGRPAIVARAGTVGAAAAIRAPRAATGLAGPAERTIPRPTAGRLSLESAAGDAGPALGPVNATSHFTLCRRQKAFLFRSSTVRVHSFHKKTFFLGREQNGS